MPVNMDIIYIETLQNEEDFVCLPIESALIIMLYKYLNYPQKIVLKTIMKQKQSNLHRNFLIFQCNFLDCVKKDNDINSVSDLKLPFYVHDKNHFISGFSAVCREMIIQSSSIENEYLLGFNKSCLQAPSETSSWTRFCEINIVDAFNKIVKQYFRSEKHIFDIPDVFRQFENHLKKPLKINDKYKKELEKSNKINKSIDTQFSEYNHPTLVDILIYLSFQLSFKFLTEKVKLELLTALPLLSKWIDNINKFEANIVEIFESAISLLYEKEVKSKYEQLYWLKSESPEIFNRDNQIEKYKQINKVATVQTNIASSLEKLKAENLIISSEKKFVSNYDLDWFKIPWEIHPNYGGIPDKRLQRKSQQLKCLIDIVMSLVKAKDIIVDFCSGSGHLGIILATLLPNCKIIFLENKQFSLLATKERIAKLNLKNCLFYQSNIDYFMGKFDIGISLHACGTATDVVLMKCIQKRAKFISCPCCYGSINPMPHISYPLSKIYKNIINERDYLYLTHAADIDINLENNLHCMDVIDTDRKLFAEEMGYYCVLSRLYPENCTPKNRILIGISDK